jgi:pimeloyl-ACP methyl ester carboxylesterase
MSISPRLELFCRHRFTRLLKGFAGSLLSAFGAIAAEAQTPSGAALTPCKLPGLEEEARCGTLEVPEDHGVPSGRRIPLKIAVLPARPTAGTAPAPDPVFAIAGGPGESAIAAAAVFAQLLEEARGERDVVLVDLRGTGGSNRLDCPLPGSDDDPQAYLGDFLPLDALRECLGRLRELGIDPAHYTTPQAVEDLEAVRAALGHGKINLYGVSYGSRAALVYLRSHPERVRSAALQGVVPTDMKAPLHHAADSQRSLDLLFAECEADEACRAAYPGLKKKLAAVQERLAKTPATAEIEDPKTKKKVRLTIPLDLFNEELRWRLYGEGPSPIPEYIQRAHEGDFSKLAATILRQRRALASGAALSIGTYLSVTCAEDVPWIDPEEAKHLARGTFLGTYRVDQQARACSVWPRGKVPAGFAAEVSSEVPVLLISGERDPATPPRWGEQVSRGLKRSRHVVFGRGAHSGRSPCVRRLLGAFLARGSVDGLDASCIDDAPKVAFTLPAAAAAPAPAPATSIPASPEGLWEGEIFIQRGWLEVELLVELFQGGPAGWAGNADLPTQGLQFVPLIAISVARPKVSFEIHRPAEGGVAAVDVRFEGELSADGHKIAGKFLEEGKTFDFALQRIGEAGIDRPAPAAPGLRLLSDRGEELRELFNRDQDKLRMVVMLSPTCPVCLQDVRVLSRYVMKAMDDPRIRFYSVWGPMEDEDTEADARKVTVNAPDPRATHFWTDDDVLADTWAQILGVVDDETGYDLWMIFPPGTRWEGEKPPVPPYFMWIEKQGLPKENKFNGVVFAEQVRRFLAAE